jgi:hypothetical protein
LPTNASALRYVYEPISDQNDGHLVDGFNWDPRLSSSTVTDLLLNLGQFAGSTYDVSIAYSLPDIPEAASVSEVKLRFNEQGGIVGSGLTVQITGAKSLDPLSVSGIDRFFLPRTSASILWNISAAWDSSGQRIAKYEESPDISPIVNELVAQKGWDGSGQAVVLFLEVVGATGNNFVRFDDVHGSWPGGNPGVRPTRLIVNESYHDAFWGKELLCRPRIGGVDVNIIPHVATDAYVQWGTDGVSFPSSSAVANVAAKASANLAITGLQTDTPYFYRLRYRPSGGGAYATGQTHEFRSMPALTQDARIAVTTDIHVTNSVALGLDTHMALLESSLAYMAGHEPNGYHLWMDLGDLVVIRAQRIAFDLDEVEQRYREAREYIDVIGSVVPFVLVRGNHEEVNGWDYNGTANNTAIWSGKALLKWFPPPLPDAYYSGNTTSFPNLGIPGDYFAFDVGPMRFRCLDPYLFSTTRPHNGHGETGGSQNGWDWTIGQQQYDWLWNDLTGETAPYSVLAIHHLTSCYDLPGYWYGRGGIEVAKHSVAGRPSFEWGGENAAGANQLATKRPGYAHGPIHDMLAATGNQVVLKGHDHFHARQQIDDMIYLTLAKPDDTAQHTGDLWGWRYSCFYPEALSTMFEDSGFLSILAGESAASFRYIQTFPYGGQGNVVDSFTILPAAATDAPDVAAAPRLTAISTVAPNPTRDGSRVQFQLGESAHVTLAIYDAAGRLVRELVNEPMEAGAHEAPWDGRDGAGTHVASGVYFAKLKSAERTDSVKMIVLR